MSPFTSVEEFRKTFDALFTLLSDDPDVGPRLRARKTPQRFVFTDAGLVLNVRDADAKRSRAGHHLAWVWGDKGRSWEPRVTLEMTCDVANRYFQGRENIPLAVARGRIRLADGSLQDVLDLLPIILPFHTTWVRHLKSTGQLHLLA